MMGQKEFECKETQWHSYVWLGHNRRKSTYTSRLSSQATLEFLSCTTKKIEVNDISDWVIISEKTKRRFFRYCLEMITRVSEDIEVKI